MNVQINTYDEIPYPNLTFFRTLPTRTAALASLFGIEPSDPHSARVLELGCAAGANVIPMAAAFPEAEFVGVDLSEKQIEEGVKTITAAGLNNISLQQENIVNIDGSWGSSTTSLPMVYFPGSRNRFRITFCVYVVKTSPPVALLT